MSNFSAKIINSSYKNRQVFSQKALNFLPKIVKFFCKNRKILLPSIINFSYTLFIHNSSKFSSKNCQHFLAKIVILFSGYFEQILICQWLCYILVVPVSFLQNSIEFQPRKLVPISTYNYIFMIEIIQTASSIISATHVRKTDIFVPPCVFILKEPHESVEKTIFAFQVGFTKLPATFRCHFISQDFLLAFPDYYYQK